MQYMRRCLQLAACGRGRVSPNPMVGAVIVCDGKIVGEGYHRQFGGPHAEVNAVAAVRDPECLSRSTLYVSLEPCSHYGKTPPCSRLIIEKKIPRVVVGCLDPFPSVSGRGVAMLREAGVEVVTGVLEAECRALNSAFMTAHERQRPYVVLKWAQRRLRVASPTRRLRSSSIVCGPGAMPYWWAHARRGSITPHSLCGCGRDVVPRCGSSWEKISHYHPHRRCSPTACLPSW